MPRQRLLLIAALVLVGVWGAVWAVGRIADSIEMTPEKIIAYVREHPLPEGDPGERREIILEVAERVNALPFDRRREFREGEAGEEGFYASLRDGEKILFIESTMDTTFKKMMQSFNAMTPERRREVVDRALSDIDNESGRDRGREELDALDPELYDRMVASGLEAFYQSASADTKMDLAPVLEKMQQRVRAGR